MPVCPCPGASSTTVAFSDGLDLRRCGACGATGWLLGGTALGLGAAGVELRARFRRARATGAGARGGRRPALNSAADLAARRRARAEPDRHPVARRAIGA